MKDHGKASENQTASGIQTGFSNQTNPNLLEKKVDDLDEFDFNADIKELCQKILEAPNNLESEVEQFINSKNQNFQHESEHESEIEDIQDISPVVNFAPGQIFGTFKIIEEK